MKLANLVLGEKKALVKGEEFTLYLDGQPVLNGHAKADQKNIYLSEIGGFSAEVRTRFDYYYLNLEAKNDKFFPDQKDHGQICYINYTPVIAYSPDYFGEVSYQRHQERRTPHIGEATEHWVGQRPVSRGFGYEDIYETRINVQDGYAVEVMNFETLYGKLIPKSIEAAKGDAMEDLCLDAAAIFQALLLAEPTLGNHRFTEVSLEAFAAFLWREKMSLFWSKLNNGSPMPYTAIVPLIR
jgi:hypothetical protein